jgi:hypothetical protein
MTYAYLLESVWHPPLAFEEPVGSALPPELELQALWFAGGFGRDFRARDGRNVRIIQFGEWNRGSGPDFAQVAVEIDGVVKTGTLELDINARDWEVHGHATNPAFASVVLHVVFQADLQRGFTRSCENREIPQILISGAQLEEALNRPPREVAIARPGRCIAPLRKLGSTAIERLLQEAALHRAAIKAKRFLRATDAHGRDAALFQATAETLGYRANPLPMRLLAQRAPLAALRANGEAAEAIVFGSAGFLAPDLHASAPTDTRDYLRGLWNAWWKSRTSFEVAPERAIAWKTHGQRPANHPHRRCGTLTALAKRWPSYRKVALARPFHPKRVVDFLNSLEHPFWNRRYTLTSAPIPGKLALFGRGQALELLANHLVPLALHEDGIEFADYYRLRSSSPNEKVKRCALRLFGSLEAAKPWLKRLCHHQGLLQVYQDFCLEDFSDCHECPFPEQMTQWK